MQKGMEIIYRDILKQWTCCWQGAVLAGILFMLVSRQVNQILNQHKVSGILLFTDGVFLYFLMNVTLLSRTIGSRREVELWPLAGYEVISGDYHFLIENILLFIPFGFLLCRTLYTYGKKCSLKMILSASFLTSVSVELLQYIFSCGKSETDDVIANVLGAVSGYLIVKLKRV